MADDPRSDRMTVCLTDDQALAAVAWRSDDLITVGFYENVVDSRSNQYAFTHLWEVRSWALPDDYPLAVPAEELAERLERWEKHDFTHVPSGYENTLLESALRSVPFHRMAQEAASAYFNADAPRDLVLPTEDELQLCRAAGPWAEFRTSRDMESAFDQLKAVACYVSAVAEHHPKPVVAATRQMFGDEESTHVTRVRNLIQFARQNEYLTKLQHGRSGGVPTRKAIELSEAIKARAASVKGEKQ